MKNKPPFWMCWPDKTKATYSDRLIIRARTVTTTATAQITMETFNKQQTVFIV